MLEELGDPKADASVIERAKATSLVAGTYISAVKVEIDAARLADDIGCMLLAVEDSLPALPAPGGEGAGQVLRMRRGQRL